jgi:photosystem II stability/assembly factor-like uncharacterized protein
MTRDGATSWAHLDGLLPSRLNDVRYAPDDPDVIIATAAADLRNLRIGGITVSGGGVWRSDDVRGLSTGGRIVSGGGIWRSADGGRTWSKPESAEPPAPCGGRTTAWGIAFENGTDNVYVGTDCGLAVSNDLGENWTHLQVSGATREVYGVAAQDGIVDLCDESGHHRLNTATGVWTGSNLGTRCMDNATHGVAVVPGDGNVVYIITEATVDTTECENRIKRKLWESPDGGGSWNLVFERCAEYRTPFVDIGGSAFDYDVYFGDGIRTFRQLGCSAARVASTKCSVATSSWEQLVYQHPDQTDIAFSTIDGCAKYMGNDGGVETSPDCGLTWRYAGTSRNGLHALQLYHVFSQVYPTHTDLYIGTQDNLIWPSTDGGRTWLRSADAICCEGGLLSLNRRASVHAGEVITGYAISDGRYTFAAKPHLQRISDWRNAGSAPSASARVPFYIDRGAYVQWADPNRGLLFRTDDFGANWDLVTQTTAKPVDVLIHVAGPPADPTLYVSQQRSGGRVGLVRITNFWAARARVVVNTVDTDLSLGRHGRGFFWNSVIGVNPTDPSQLIAADVGDDVIKASTDSGTTWIPQPALTNLITGGGDFLFDANAGGTSLVSEIMFDPVTPVRIFIGTVYNGVFVSYDSGNTWAKIPGSEAMGDISGFAFDELRDEIFVSTWGRGLWTLDLPRALTPDAFESNDTPVAATPPERARLEHRHLRPFDAVENSAFLGATSEEWVWTFAAANLHDPDDRDFFRITLPDPEADQPAHHGLPECATLPRDALVPGATPRLFITGRLTVVATGRDTGDRVKVYAYDPVTRRAGAELESEIVCPRSWHGLSDVLVSFGERSSDDFRGDFAEYDLIVRYRIDIQTVLEPADWLAAILEGEEARGGGGAGIGALPCKFGTFPFCPLEEALTVQVPRLPHPKCFADGPQCPMYYFFNWTSADEPLLFTITSDQGTFFELVDHQQKTILRATPIAEDNLSITQRLAVPALKPGLYALAVFGRTREFMLEFNHLDEPADLNENGIADHIERQLIRSQDGN